MGVKERGRVIDDERDATEEVEIREVKRERER